MKLTSVALRTFALGALVLSLPGCPFVDDWEPPQNTNVTWTSPGSTPRIRDIAIPAFPPLGPDGSLEVECEDDQGLTALEMRFRNAVTLPLRGPSQTVSLRGTELGEGYGLLQLRLSNTRRGTAERAVENLLVDLTPPEVEMETRTVSPRREDGEIVLWVQDRWVLGFVELSFRGKTLRHEFPKAYPATLGTSWDESRVSFPAAELEEGAGSAIVVVADAAGNRALREMPLLVDATAPVVSMQLPAEGQVVRGDFDIAVTASDPNNPVQVSVDLFVGGSLVGTVLGPRGSLTVDTGNLSPGPVDVEAVAYDEAGNVSEAAVTHVLVE